MRPLSPSLFHGRHFDRAIIVLCVRWYITYKLSYRDLVELMAERGVAVSHTTIPRWVQRFAPEVEKRWQRYDRPVGRSWRVDETYIRVRGRWSYLYRAVDKQGLTVDEQDHRRVKQRIYPMLGFKNFANAATTIGGIELVQKIKKGQFNITQLKGGMEVRVTQVWGAVLVD